MIYIFTDNEDSQEYYLPIANTEISNVFIIDRKSGHYTDTLDQYVFEFFESESSTTVLLFPDKDHSSNNETLEKFKQELKLYGIHENQHYEVQHIEFENDSDSEIDNTFNYRHEYCFTWNKEFILKYTNSD